jgi:hypothetical protein
MSSGPNMLTSLTDARLAAPPKQTLGVLDRERNP